MTLKDAIKNGIDKIRLPEWEPSAYLQLHLLPNGTAAIWGKLHDVSGEVSVPLWKLQDEDRFTPLSK